MAKFQVPAEKVQEIRSWFKLRGGVLLWTNKEIGNPRPDLITPASTPAGNHPTAPHWAYVGQPTVLTVADLEVCDRQILDAPAELFKPCERCKGSKRRSLAELAAIRRETYQECLEKARPHTCPQYELCPHVHVEDLNEADGTFQCNHCHGTGLQNSGILYARYKRMYYGGVELVSTKKVEKAIFLLRKQTNKIVHYDIEPDDRQMARLVFYHETVTPFTLKENNSGSEESGKETAPSSSGA